MTDEAILVGRQFHVQFVRCDDRYAHVISRVRGHELFPLLESIEGSPQEQWPASPVLQSLHVQSGEPRQLAMLVGMAGRSHWSVAVELAVGGEVEQLTFDVACRMQCPAEFLGSRYRAGDDVHIGAREIRFGEGVCGLTLGEGEENRTGFVQGDRDVLFRPHEQGGAPPTTRRWTYSLQCWRVSHEA